MIQGGYEFLLLELRAKARLKGVCCSRTLVRDNSIY